MSTSHITPTPGRIVWYRGADGAIRPAIVIKGNGQFNADLYVFPLHAADTDWGNKATVTHADPEQEPGCLPSWHWMPYQKQQAEKHANEAARADEPKTRAIDTSDAAIEREIVAKGKTAPRVTPADIEANIASEHYFTAGEAVYGPERAKGADAPLDLLTFCVLTLTNGFTVTGESACASPENFDAEIGRNIARQNAVQKIWPLMGYALKQRLHDAANLPPAPGAAHAGYSTMPPHQQRVVDERAELDGRLAKLNTFIDGVTFSTLDADSQNLLKQQAATMAMYSDILSERIAAF